MASTTLWSQESPIPTPTAVWAHAPSPSRLHLPALFCHLRPSRSKYPSQCFSFLPDHQNSCKPFYRFFRLTLTDQWSFDVSSDIDRQSMFWETLSKMRRMFVLYSVLLDCWFSMVLCCILRIEILFDRRTLANDSEARARAVSGTSSWVVIVPRLASLSKAIA